MKTKDPIPNHPSSQWKVSKIPPPPPENREEEDPIVFKSSGSRVISKHHQRAAEVCEVTTKSSNSNVLKHINNRIIRSAPCSRTEHYTDIKNNVNDNTNNNITNNKINLGLLKKVHGRILSPVSSQKNNYVHDFVAENRLAQVFCVL